MSDQRSYVPYTASIETPAGDEAEVIGKIILSMTKESQTVAATSRTISAVSNVSA